MRFRAPFVGALAERPEQMGLVLFVLFMLASTTYDAIHDTEMWLNVYWKQLIVLAQPLWGTDMAKAEGPLMLWYLIFKRGGLLLSLLVLPLYVPTLIFGAEAVKRGAAGLDGTTPLVLMAGITLGAVALLPFAAAAAIRINLR